MIIKSISLTDFRNFDNLSLSFDDQGRVFYGKNGIGKTNLLEAICYCAYGKSIRSLSDLDLIRLDQSFFVIKAEFLLQNKKFLLEASLDKKSRKLIKINNTRLSRVSELYKYLKIVYFSQDDVNLIEGAPKGRRQFFDMAIAQGNYAFIEKLKRFYQYLKQRNALLKSEYVPAEKRVWDTKFIEAAESVIKTRLTYLQKLNNELERHYRNIGYDNEKVSIRYHFSYPYDKNADLKEILNRELKRLENDEKRYQRSLIGPQLDDFVFILDNRNINRFGSHGQKRCLAIAVKLALASLISATSNDRAILIFDDVLADLDEKRAHSIIDSLGDKNQLFIATPTPTLYHSMNLPFFNMEDVKN